MMKWLVVLALTIVAVSGKHLLTNDELSQSLAKMKEEYKEVESYIKTHPQEVATETMTFMNAIDSDIRSKITKDSAKIIRVIIDSNKTLGERYNEVAQIQQNTADLWKEAASKYNAANPQTSTTLSNNLQ